MKEELRAYSCPTKLSLFCRMKLRLFPKQICFAPDVEFSKGDCHTAHTLVYLGFVDRLRVLLTGIVVVETKTVTENLIGKYKTSSVSYVGTSFREDL